MRPHVPHINLLPSVHPTRPMSPGSLKPNTLYNVGEHPNVECHMVHLLDSDESFFIRPSDVRNLAITIHIGAVTYIIYHGYV